MREGNHKTNRSTNGNKLASILLLPPSISVKSLKEINEISKIFKKNTDKKDQKSRKCSQTFKAKKSFREKTSPNLV